MENQDAQAEVKSFFSITNIILLGVLTYFIYARIARKSVAPTLSKPIEPLPIRDYTPQDLKKYNGVDDPHILMAIRGKVYDVTAGSMFYGPRGPYKNFGGRDASRALAMGSFEDDMFVSVDGPIDDLNDLDSEQEQAVNDWISHFDGKYISAGYLIENGTETSASQ